MCYNIITVREMINSNKNIESEITMKFNYKYSVNDTFTTSNGLKFVIESRYGRDNEPKYIVRINGEPKKITEKHIDEMLSITSTEVITETHNNNKLNDFHEKINNYITMFKEKCPTLIKFGTCYSEKALYKELTPCFGREEEINIINYLLYRRTKPNIMLLGRAGVGKTAIVEGLSVQLNNDFINGKTNKFTIVHELCTNAMLSGSKYRGDFEEKAQKLLDEIQGIKEFNIVVFIDEIHSINMLGNAEGATSLGQILKPALARGQIHLIGATTIDEYEQYLKNDKALCRRFNILEVQEFSGEKAITILQKILLDYGEYFKQDVSNIDIKSIYNNYYNKLNGTFPDNFINIIDETLAYITFNNSIVTTEDFITVAKRNSTIKPKMALGFR